MNSPLLSSFSAVEDVLFNFAQSDGLGQVNQVNSARNQGLTAPELNTVVFLDAGVTDYQSLQAGVIPGVATVILSAKEDGIEQITAFLQQNPQITTIHLVSHGAPGCLYLGNCQLNLTNIYDYRQQLQNWAKINHILLYGCQVAAGDAGEEFIEKLHQLTGARIVASAKRTGNEALGGDWELEVTVPQSKIENRESQIPLAFRDETVASYQSVLAQELVPFLVKDINPGSSSSDLSELTDANGTLFFRTYDYFLSIEKLWKSDGTEAGTTDISSAYFDLSYSSVFNLTNVNGILYFTAVTGTFGFLYSQLWSIDGTTVERFLDFPPDYFPDNLTEVEYTLFFTVHDFTRIDSPKLFAGSSLVGDIYSGSGDAHVSNLTDVNGTLYFTADDGIHFTELWKSDGNGMEVINPGFQGFYINNLTNVNGTLFFRAEDDFHGYELWQSDGTEAGTVLVKDIQPGFYNSSNPDDLTNVNGTLFFTADDGTHGIELWKSDGTETGTVLVKDIVPGSSSSLADNLTNVNGILFFTADDGLHGLELWQSDGTEAGTVLVKDINPGNSSSSPDNLTNVNGTLFFTADDGTHGIELWQSDGTADGTVLVGDINPGSSSSYPSSLTNVNGTLFFTADDGIHGGELWSLALANVTITLDINPLSVTEDGTTNLVYTFTRTGSPTNALTVNFTVAGSAAFNSDYTQIGAASFTGTEGTIAFAPGSATANLTIDPTADTIPESDETVALTLAAGTGYAIGTSTAVTGTITNDDDTNLLWIRQLGTPNEDGPWGGGIATDGNENLYVTGVTFGNLEGINAGPPDAFLVKYDKNGNLAWKKQLGSSNYEWYEQVATDSNNNVYLSGGTAGNLAGTNAGLEDLFLAKYDQNGHQIWVLQYGSYSWDSPLGMTIDSGNNIYLAGATGSNLGGANAGDIDAYLIKYDENGNRLWVKQWGTVNFDHADDIALDSSGNLYISGHTDGNLGGTNAGSSDAFLAKYDLNGHQIWIEQLGSSGDDTGPEGVEVITDSAGNVYIASSTNGNLGGTNAGGKDAWVAKYDSSGNQLWLKQFGTAADDIATDVKTDAFGNLYLTGQTAGSLGGTNAGGTDAWFAKYDENGNLLWIQQTGTSADDSATGIAPITAGNFYLTGGTEGSLGGPNAGDFDIWVAKYSQPSNLIPTLGNSTYYLTTATTWTDAEAQAVAMGGHLVTVNDATENLFLVNTFGTESLWIGYTDAAVEGQWEWVSGETSTYTNWAPGQPDNYLGSQDYARYTNYQSLGNWDDLDNNQNLRGIVEIKNTTPTVTLAVSPESVTEDGTTNLVYTFTRTGVTTNALTVNYTLGGTATLNTDYTRTGTTNTVTFAAGSSTATVIVDPTADTTVEDDETVALTLASGTGYTVGTPDAVTGTINNDDTSITLAVSPESVTEDGTTNLVYTFTRTGVTTDALTVNYTVGGTATNGTDYTSIPTSVTFAANSATATVTVDPTADTTVESDETVALTLTSGTGYTVGTTTAVTGTINNDDTNVTLAVSPESVSEDGTTNLVYTFTRTGVTTDALTVNYTVEGTATNGTDYTSIPTSVTFAAGSDTATVTIDPTADTTVESDETVILTLASGTGYTVRSVESCNKTSQNQYFTVLN